MTEKLSKTGNDQISSGPDGGPGKPDAEIPAAGVKSRLTDAQKEMLASKSRGGGAGMQSVGTNPKATHASGKLGPAPKKVRW
ncbi:hypothetical protein [Pseudarthrobacter sp. N5]|uniref:hypothetical protein n=1 Tax=Pseudarthrobacter sp. N5 TaxID=3418416 RepID=UPI003CF4F369